MFTRSDMVGDLRRVSEAPSKYTAAVLRGLMRDAADIIEAAGESDDVFVNEDDRIRKHGDA